MTSEAAEANFIQMTSVTSKANENETFLNILNIVMWTNFQITKLTCKRSTEELGELLALLKW